MRPNTLARTSLLALLISNPVMAASDEEVAELKAMLKEMKQDYQNRISILEKKIAEAERTTEQASAPPPPAASNVTAVTGASSFNPAVSLVLQGTASSYSLDPDEWALEGFQTGGEAGLLPEGLSLRESELVLSANVDNWFYAQFTLGMHEEDGSTEVEVEEAFVDTLSLPANLGLRMGRFYAETGYNNLHHSHTWDFVDAPLVGQAFLGKQYKDDGLRLSWLAPTDLYLELGIEALSGRPFPFSSDENNFLGDSQNYFARLGGDVGVSHSYRIGLSHIRATPDDRTGGHAHSHDEDSGHQPSFSGDSKLSILDAVWKWAPAGNRQNQNVTLQGEYFYRDEDGVVTIDEDAGSALLSYSGIQEGFYLQGAYQFMPHWRVGLRYDSLWSDNDLGLISNTTGEEFDELAEETGLQSHYDPYRISTMLDWSPSEFSRLRFQYSYDKSRPEADDQFYLQYIMTIGAHGAHLF